MSNIDFSKLGQAGAHASKLDFSKATEVKAGDTINFSKANPTANRIRMELHWQCKHDVDAAIVLTGANGKALQGVTDENNPNTTRGMVWYKNTDAPGIHHSGDAREADGDPSSPEEVITVSFKDIDSQATTVKTIATTFPDDDEGKGPAIPFSQVEDCRVDFIDDETNKVLYVMALSEAYKDFTSVELVSFNRTDTGEWELTYLGIPVGKQAMGLADIATKYDL